MHCKRDEEGDRERRSKVVERVAHPVGSCFGRDTAGGMVGGREVVDQADS